jgi:glutaredoxin 3
MRHLSKITIYTKDYCGYCAHAKALLTAKGVDFTKIDVTNDRALEAEMIERSGWRTVPQIFIDDRNIGGSDDLAALDARGELDPLLSREVQDADSDVQHHRLVIRNIQISDLWLRQFGAKSRPSWLFPLPKRQAGGAALKTCHSR